MAKVAVIYHSGYGHTKSLALAVEAGAKEVSGVEVTLLTAEEAIAKLDMLDSQDALIFGCPTYMGSASAKFKEFMEASSKKWLTLKWKNKLAAGFTNSGSLSGDKLCTLTELVIFAAQHGMLWVSLGYNAPAPQGTNGGVATDINRLGSFIGVMAQSDHMSDPAKSPPEGDLATGKLLGKRVATLAQSLAGHIKEPVSV
jgi:multimeric flavodoxin WrbA